MFNHQDTLNELNKNIPLGEKLTSIHDAIKRQYAFVDRIAIAIYDHKTDLLKTYLHSSGGESPLTKYQMPLAQSPSLKEIIKQHKPRVVNDLKIFAQGEHEHTQRIREHGYASSYTMPMYLNDVFFWLCVFQLLPVRRLQRRCSALLRSHRPSDFPFDHQ